MKKILAIVLMLAMMLSIGTTAFAYGDTSYPFLFKTEKGTPTIDGVRDEAYEASDMIDIMQPGMNDYPIDGHATAKVWTLWDDTNIYVYTEVNDPTPGDSWFEGINPWVIDSVEIYVDFKNTKDPEVEMHDEELTGQIRFCRNSVDYVTGEGQYTQEVKDKIEYKVIDNGEQGYVVEAAIPHRELAQKIGFFVQINDDMNDDLIRDMTIFTKMDGSLACQYNYVYDTLDLVGCTATNGYEDDTITYNSLEDLHELNAPPVVEDPVSSEETSSAEDASTTDTSDVTEPPVDDAGSPVIWIILGAVLAAAVVAVVVVVIIKGKKK